MNETPKCPYCGAEMMLIENKPNSAWYECLHCCANSPIEGTPEAAFTAALRRAEPENRVLTAEEATGSEDPVWLETRKTLMITDVCIAADYHYAEVYTIGSRIPYLLLLDSYGKLWRCWPRKPTPEQMEDAKWEE